MRVFPIDFIVNCFALALASGIKPAFSTKKNNQSSQSQSVVVIIPPAVKLHHFLVHVSEANSKRYLAQNDCFPSSLISQKDLDFSLELQDCLGVFCQLVQSTSGRNRL